MTVTTSIDQCIDTQVQPDLVLQAIDTARRDGRINKATAELQRRELRDAFQ